MTKFFAVSAFLLSSVVGFAQYSTEQVRTFYAAKSSQYNLSTNDLSSFVITDQYTDASTGVTHIYLRQMVNGIEIIDANSSIHLDKTGNVLVFNNAFKNNVIQRINATSPAIAPIEAVQQFATTIDKTASNVLSKMATPLVNNKVSFVDPALSNEPIAVKKYYLTVGETLRLVWNVELYDPLNSDKWHSNVDALTGEVLTKFNLTVKCNPAIEAHEVYEAPNMLMNTEEPLSFGKKGDATYNIFPIPIENPSFGNRQLTGSPATSNASPYGWHDTDGVAGADFTYTRGNNIYAKEDTLGNDGMGYSPDGGLDQTFDFPYSMYHTNRENLDAAITNLFYWGNLNHDIFYNYGFDEVAGNFQANNYGKGGTAHDGVFADAQDGSSSNNANFIPSVEGERGRMQMFPFSASVSTTNNLQLNNTTLAGKYIAPPASFGPVVVLDITGDLMLAKDGSTNYTACNTLSNDLTGKIALIYKGNGCSYPQKVLKAQNAGAIAVIVVNNQNSAAFTMSGSSAGVNIPSVMITKSMGDQLKTWLLADSVVNVTLIGDTSGVVYPDGDMDNFIMSHEYGHGISTRLVGGPSTVACLSNGEQAGEGWSDFFGLCLTAKASDSTLDGRGTGAWVLGKPFGSIGIRTYKYSKNMSVNPMTYNSIKSSFGDPHYSGSVWCTVLYDMYWDMVAKYGFNPDFYENTIGGNNMMLQLVVDGLKLQPCSPGMMDARDAIIEADKIRNGGANKDLLWKAFARRGFGWSANQNDPNSNSDGIEAFDMPPLAGLVEDKAWDIVQVYPNPTSNSVNIVLPDRIQEVQVALYDLAGKKVFDTSSMIDGVGKLQIDLSSMDKGIYLIQVSAQGHVYQTKLMVQ